MIFRALFLLLLLPLVAGCNKGIDMAPAMTAWQDMTPSVTSFDEMKFTPVQVPAVVADTFAVGNPVFDFGSDGTSYFRAYALPEAASPYVLEVTSDRAQYSCVPCTMGTLMPDVLLLDADKKPIGKAAFQKPAVDYGDGEGLRRYVWTTITPEMGARHVVVYTPRASIGREETGYIAGGGGVAYAGGLFIPVPGPYYKSTGMPIGSMRFVLRLPESE